MQQNWWLVEGKEREHRNSNYAFFLPPHRTPSINHMCEHGDLFRFKVQVRFDRLFGAMNGCKRTLDAPFILPKGYGV